MWFIEGCSGTTQGKKMALVSICSAKSQGIHIPNLLLIMPVYVFAPDMRKALSQDVEKKSIIPLKRPITPDELEYD
jgi:hypothetical protein